MPARYAFAFLCVIALLIVLPLFAVWRQVYITSSSIAQEQLADSVAVLNQKVTQLRMSAEHLAGNERIERIARESLNLEYAVSEQIVIVRPPVQPRQSIMAGWGFLAVLRRSLEQEKG